MLCIHTNDEGIIKYPHDGTLSDCIHPCINEKTGEPNHRIGQGFSGKQFYCDSCGLEKTKKDLRRMGLNI